MYNPTTSHFGGTYDAVVKNIIEDISHRDSALSYFIQLVDVIAHLLYRKEFPKSRLKKFNIDRLYDVLEPIILKKASPPDGVVRR
ncbi:MAG: DUF3800 domain-containing protein [Mucilaginibacter polytrichastri]|nr:DUF3800 domain-containing protein [Mucilaginibacter polytrichastri]